MTQLCFTNFTDRFTIGFTDSASITRSIKPCIDKQAYKLAKNYMMLKQKNVKYKVVYNIDDSYKTNYECGMNLLDIEIVYS